MNFSALAESLRKSDFCRSAITSIENPTAHSSSPINIHIPNGRCVIEVIDAKAAAMVINTQAPPSVQVNKYRQKLFLSSVNLLSCPAFLTRINRKLPSLIAQIATKTAIMRPRKSSSGCMKIAVITAVTYDTDPVKSK